MAQPSRLLLLLFLLSIFAFDLPAQRNGTLHLITAIDVINEDIAQGCKKDYENANEIFKFIAQTGGMNYQAYNLEFKLQSVTSFFTQFHCGTNDAIVFLYSGHGLRYDDDGDDWPWPYMYFCDIAEKDFHSDNCEADLEELHDDIKSILKPRMALIIGNSCNESVVLDTPINSSGESSDFTEGQDELTGIELFTKFRGNIITSACGPGQKSYTTDENGSYFVVDLFKYIADALASQERTSWMSILEQTRSSVVELNQSQVPQYKIE